ncbi:hypothetical protein F2Q69_00053922 [Brassica cretica]|uniref:Uncharacterized protein n=1 Tax=Brassica cretica TaxID=69181 RepID=A0A8S9N1S8_BRACR|nr:hypothetical protein F2Q69_00053922 [Brassica cretica]
MTSTGWDELLYVWQQVMDPRAKPSAYNVYQNLNLFYLLPKKMSQFPVMRLRQALYRHNLPDRYLLPRLPCCVARDS